jgi:hypothetical protein
MATAVDANAPLIELIRDREVQDPPCITYYIADAAHPHCAIEIGSVPPPHVAAHMGFGMCL